MSEQGVSLGERIGKAVPGFRHHQETKHQRNSIADENEVLVHHGQASEVRRKIASATFSSVLSAELHATIPSGWMR